MSQAPLTRRLKERAAELGFMASGVVSVKALGRDDHRLGQWLEQGFAADMDYMKRTNERRERMLSGFPWAKNAVLLAIPYAGRKPFEPKAPLSGRVARYAWGKNYHKVIKKKLAELIAFLQADLPTPFQAEPFVDTAPILERSVAEQAGLGFVGKNTTLIQPRHGSFFFLAGFLTDADLEQDRPLRRDAYRGEFFGCGTCTRCLDVCPTQALTAPYQLDAGRCISYQTIENRGTIPVDIREGMGEWVFGCDLCLEVCPYNAKAVLPDPAFEPSDGPGERLDLGALLSLRTDQAFLEAYSGTSLIRSKREGLLRNAAVAAGNSGDPDAVPMLVKALQEDGSALVRSHAAWALGRLGSLDAVGVLTVCRDTEKDGKVLEELDSALARCQGSPAVPKDRL